MSDSIQYCSTYCFKSVQSTNKSKHRLNYKHRLGVSAILGASAAGFAGCVKPWKPSIAIGCIVSCLSMLFKIPDKLFHFDD